MRFLSVCSGIEAASVAWNPLGWKAVAFSEIEPFPCAVLAHHYPDTPNWGDMTKYKEWPDVAIDLLCGGTPCQSFSVAGLRKGLDDPRGNLMLTFGAIAAKYRPKWLVWENVPGVLSSNGGQDFASFLGLLTGQVVKVPAGGWSNSGIVSGIRDAYGVAYRVLDAQYFGVPQRRRRVFVVGCLGDWRSAAAVLFERHGLSGDPAPSRQARKGLAPTLSARPQGGGALGTDFDCDGGLIAGTLQASGRAAGSATQQDAHSGMLLARCLTRGSGGGQRYDAESETLIAHTLLGKHNSSHAADQDTYITHSLRGEGFDASEDGTGRGTPLVPMPFDTTQITSPENGSNPQPGDPCHPLAARAHAPAIAFDSRQDPVASEHLFGALGSSSPQAQAVTTLAIRGRGESHQLETRSDGTANALLTPNGGRAGIGVGAIHYGMQVRRLTPEECEALQAYPRGYTRVPGWNGWRAMDASETPESCRAAGMEVRQTQKTKKWRVRDVDGPRYKALGNSWCVTNVRWIGQRIDRVNSILESV
ncbi:Modification methylase HpaII [compost metagenome]